MEPRATNAKIIRCMSRAAGFVHTRTFDFPHKRAALLELTRDRFFHGAEPVSGEGENGLFGWNGFDGNDGNVSENALASSPVAPRVN
jgi:hypothetical protein